MKNKANEAKQRLNILVTGGCGFLGTHLCRALIHEGHTVTVLDSRPPSHPIQHVNYRRGDVRDPLALEQALQNVDVVYHFAAIVNPMICEQKPVESYETNFLATCQILETMQSLNKQRSSPMRIVFASSFAVYGDIGKKATKLDEKNVAPAPISLYASQKLFSEITIRHYAKQLGVPATVFRFFNVFGPGQDSKSPYSFLISNFFQRLSENRPLGLFGKGVQTRDFVSVHDVIRACTSCLNTAPKFWTGEAINLGTAKGTSIKQLALETMKIAKVKVSTNVEKTSANDVQFATAKIDRAKKVLGWKPEVKLQEALEELHSDFQLTKAA